MPTRSTLDEIDAITEVVVGPDRVELLVSVSPVLHQPYGIVHGGVYTAAAERAAELGGQAWLGDRGRARATAVGTQFLRAVREGEVRVEAVPVHRGRGQQLWQVRLTAPAGPEGDAIAVVATSEVRLFNQPA